MDTAKGSFWLVAIIIGTQMFIAAGIAIGCLGGVLSGAVPIGTCKDVTQPVIEIFQMSFTAAIAFAGGRMTAPQTPLPKLPDKDKIL